MKKLILIFIVAFTQQAVGQDTIYKINGEKIASKIEEINPTGIKFRKFANLTGPMYSESNTEIFRIKFANGSIDTIVQVTEIKPQVISPSEESQVKSSKPKRSLMYNVSDEDLLYEVQLLPLSDSKNKMLKEYSKMVDYKRNQYLANGLGLAIGFAVPVVTTFYSFGNYYNNFNGYVFVGGIIAGAAIRITGQVLKTINKNKRLNAKRNVIRLYEELN